MFEIILRASSEGVWRCCGGFVRPLKRLFFAVFFLRGFTPGASKLASSRGGGGNRLKGIVDPLRINLRQRRGRQPLIALQKYKHLLVHPAQLARALKLLASPDR